MPTYFIHSTLAQRSQITIDMTLVQAIFDSRCQYNFICLNIYNTARLSHDWQYDTYRGLGRIWETGCVQFWLAMLAGNSFSVLPHLQIKYWATFLAQLLKKT